MLGSDPTATRADLPPPQLRAAWDALRQREPDLRARDLAERLGVSEGELIAARCGEGITRLDGPWPELVSALPALGHVMALTRNDSCVHEKKGAYDHVEVGGAMGMVLAGAIDLRLFFNHFRHGFAVREESRGRTLRSLQFFDGDGRAVHKVYATERTDIDAWRQLVARFKAGVQSPLLELRTVADPLPHVLHDEAVDVEALRAGWRAMRDPHQFVALLKKHKVTRTQALRLVGAPIAQPVGNDAIRRVLDRAAATDLPLMVFVGSPGVVQIHNGPVANIRRVGPWLNVLDADFNLHLREDHIAASWRVQKPTADGPVTSLELYDARGGQIVQVFGRRKPGTPELAAWRALTDELMQEARG